MLASLNLQEMSIESSSLSAQASYGRRFTNYNFPCPSTLSTRLLQSHVSAVSDRHNVHLCLAEDLAREAMGTLRVVGHGGKFGAVVWSANRHTISHHVAAVRSAEAHRHNLHSYSLRHATAMMRRHADTEPCIRRRDTDRKSLARCTAEPVDRRKQERTGRRCGTRIEQLNRCYNNGS